MSNCLLSINLFGARKVTATKVSFGMTLNNIEAEGRTNKTLHSSNIQGGSFKLDLVFRNHREYAQTMEWLLSYMRWIASPDGNVSPVRCVIPARNFDKTGVLTTGVTFGDQVGMATYKASLEFTGAEDTLDRVHWSKILSDQFQDPVEGTVAPYLPANNAGEQLYSWDAVSNDVVFDYGEGKVF